MPARKPISKKVAAASTKKPASGKQGVIVLYAVPIREAIARGDIQEMKKLAAIARKQIAEVSAALASLDKQIGKLR